MTALSAGDAAHPAGADPVRNRHRDSLVRERWFVGNDCAVKILIVLLASAVGPLADRDLELSRHRDPRRKEPRLNGRGSGDRPWLGRLRRSNALGAVLTWVEYRVNPAKVTPPIAVAEHRRHLVPDHIIGKREFAAAASGPRGTGTCSPPSARTHVEEQQDRHPHRDDLAGDRGGHHCRRRRRSRPSSCTACRG